MGVVEVILLIGAAVGLAVAVAGAVVVGVRRWTEARGIEVVATGPDVLSIRTPVGKGTAQIVVHEDHGRVYAIRTEFRGEPVSVTYVPPAAHLVLTHVTRQVAANQTRRRAVGRTVVRLR